MLMARRPQSAAADRTSYLADLYRAANATSERQLSDRLSRLGVSIDSSTVHRYLAGRPPSAPFLWGLSKLAGRSTDETVARVFGLGETTTADKKRQVATSEAVAQLGTTPSGADRAKTAPVLPAGKTQPVPKEESSVFASHPSHAAAFFSLLSLIASQEDCLDFVNTELPAAVARWRARHQGRESSTPPGTR